ncbi:hypothetical protein Tco_0675211 [Tanacetum coccineum]
MGRCRDEIATADIHATNILLQGLPRDIYKLINHNTDAKDIWDNVKMLLEGSELTKDDREYQLYNEFEHFGQHKGENIHDYYVRFTKLINDMRHIKMTMPKIQLNSKFVNNRLPEWGRFVMAFKLNRGLKESNHDQLYAYLKQHESHANKNKMLKERLNQHSHDPLALVSNVSPYQYPSSSSVPPQPSYTPPVTYQPQFLDNTQLDTAPLAQTMSAKLFNLLIMYDEAGPSYDSDTLSEVQNHDNCLDNMNESHDEHKIHNDVQLNDVFESDTEYLSNSNIISVAIGYKNPFYLSKAKQVQPALYNGHEIVKTNHARALVHDSEDTLEIAETTRKQMIEKMKDPECVKKKVKIAPHDYSKENYLATFTPQKQLTPEQIFWFDDLLKMKAKALKEKAKSAKPITAMTVYPPNTPAKLVPKSPPNKKSSTRERGFEQTKTCYLTEVIPFFKTIKDHFEGIQKALVNEIKEMKEVFDQMEAEVDQHAVDKKCDEIELKNLLIENENLIADCLSKDVFYTATNFVLTVYRFSDMHDAYTAAQKPLVQTWGGTLKFAIKFLKIENLKEQLQGRGNTISELKEKISRLQVKHSDADPILDFKALDSQNKDSTIKVNALQDLNERFRAENEKVKQHYKKLYNSIKLTRAKTIEKTNSLLAEIENLKAQIKGKMTCVTMLAEKPKVLAPGVKGATAASGSKPRRNTKKDRTLPTKSDMQKVKDHPRINKSSVIRKNRVDSSISYKRTVIYLNSNDVCKTCNKCLMSFNHDECVMQSLKFVRKPPVNKVWRVKQVKQVWQATRKLFANVGSQWKLTGRKFTLEEQCPITRFTKSKVVHVRQPKTGSTSDIVITERLHNTSQKPLNRYQRKNKQEKATSTGIPTIAEIQTTDSSVIYIIVSANQQDPNQN